MASSNTVTHYNNIVHWFIGDASGGTTSSGDFYWWSTAVGQTANHAKQPPDTGTWWNVKTITYLPSSDATTGSAEYMRLYEKDASGPLLFVAVVGDDRTAISQTYDPPLRCRPHLATSKCDEFAASGSFIFHLA